MKKLFTQLFMFVLPMLIAQQLCAQTVITQWNFNSDPPDASTSTGSMTPSLGAGTTVEVGGTTSSFASGASNGGSTDPTTADNTGLNITSFPASSTADKTAGLKFNVPTTGYQNIIVNYDLRHSNTSSRYEQFQYTLDATAATPIWVDFGTPADGNAGDTWFNNRTINLSTITALNNNATAGFRVVSTFNGSTDYTASNATSTYGGGTWRFDMVTVSGSSTSTDVIPPVATSYSTLSNSTSIIVFNEAVSLATATNIANYVFAPALAISSATLSTTADTIFLTHAAIVDGLPYTIIVSNVQDLAANTMVNTNFNVLFNSSLPNLVITEIAHSPNTMEFIEVYNAGNTSINLGGLKWTDGTTGDFPTIALAPGANVLFSTNPTSANALMGGTYYTLNNGLGGSSDDLLIRNSLNQVVDSVEYFVGINGWPAAPTSSPYGYSFELNAAINNNALGINWMVPLNIIASTNGTINATPGVYPPPAPNPAPQILTFGQTSATNAYIVFNQAVTTATATTTANYVFAPTLAISNATLSASSDTVQLTFAAMPDGVAHSLTVSGVMNAASVSNTPATLDFIWNQSMPNLVITEIAHSPNDIEFIEVYNAGTTPIAMGGLYWANGTTGNFPVSTLAVGGTAVFCNSPSPGCKILNLATVYSFLKGLSY